MGRKEKLKAKLLTKPKNFTWLELKSLLGHLGFELINGKGSRRKFFNKKTGTLINLHEPHPEKTLKTYVIEQVLEKLTEMAENDD